MPSDVAADDDAPPPMPLAGFAIAWAIFWIMLIVIAVLDHLRQGGTADLW